MKAPPPVILVVTSIEDVTANLVIEALNKHGARVARVDPADVAGDLAFGFRISEEHAGWTGRLRTSSRDIALDEIRAVYYRRPTSYAARFAHLPPQEAEFAATEARHGLGGVLNDLHRATYVNHPAAIARAEFKPAQLQAAVQLGLRIPPTLVTNDVVQAREFIAEHGRVVYKSFRGVPPTADGFVSAIWTQRIHEKELDDSLSVTAHLFQKEVDKHADARVTVVGRTVFASRITTPHREVDWRYGDWNDHIYEPVDVPTSIKSTLYSYLDRFGLIFGCFDFAIEEADGGGTAAERWTFIECNPNGQWGWLPESQSMARAFADVLLEGCDCD